jgi:hypothetical protein
MELTAKLIQKLPLQSGEGKNGTWRKQDIIVETGDQYPKKICVAIWGDKINDAQLQIGNQLTISFDVESREFNSRWYTDVKAWKIEVVGSTPSETPPPSFAPSTETPPPPPADIDDDLPF